MMKGRHDETLGELLTRQVYGLVFWLLTVATITVETNFFLSLSAAGRVALGVAVFLAVIGLGVGLILALRSARGSDEVMGLLKTALENPGKINYTLGGLKKAVEDWRVEALTEAGPEGPDVFVAGEKIE